MLRSSAMPVLACRGWRLALRATRMEYRGPVSDHRRAGCVARTAATLMTRPCAAFAQPGSLRERFRCVARPDACFGMSRVYRAWRVALRATQMEYRGSVSDHPR